MSAHTKTSQIMEILQAIGLEVAVGTIEDIPVNVARGLASGEYDPAMKVFLTIFQPFLSKKFTVYFYIAIGEVENLSKQTLEQFADSTYEFCKAAAKVDKKKKKIKYKGITCIPILLSENADIQAKNWAIDTVKPHYQAIEIPVIINPDTNDIIYNEMTPFRMRVFYTPGKDLIESLIRKTLSGIE